MPLQASYRKHTLQFKFEAGTSRGNLIYKDTYFVKITDSLHPEVYGLGECSPLKGLSIDDIPDYEQQLHQICKQLPEISTQQEYMHNMEILLNKLTGNQFPSIRFGFETALLDLANGGRRIIFENTFSQGKGGIPINGLIWMGNENFMRRQIDEKLEQGYTCIKMKIGALDFDKECALLNYIRKRYPAEQITLRVDANGAFAVEEALDKLKILARFQLHSIEQPIRQGQYAAMAELCNNSSVPIALDEELIGIMGKDEKEKLLHQLKPQFIILKPSLLGGFKHCQEWIEIASKLTIGWWITSALESNIGLNAISQFTANLPIALPQGLGTGQLYTNNIASPLKINSGYLYYNLANPWEVI